MNQIIKIAWDLNEKTENRYQLVYEIADLAKRLVDESMSRRNKDEFGFDDYNFDSSSMKKENPVEHAIMVKASEDDDAGLVG